MRKRSRRVSPHGIERVNCNDRMKIMEVRWVFLPGWSSVVAHFGQEPIESFGEQVGSK